MIERWVCLGAYFAQIALQCVWYLVWHPPVSLPVGAVLPIALAPLVLPLPGLLRDRRSSYIWASFVSLLYFIHGATEAWVNPAVWTAAVTEVGLSLAVMAASSLRLARG